MKHQEIYDNGLTFRVDGYLYIDTKLWTTQAELAKKLKVTRNTVNNRVRRYIANGLLPDYYIEPLGIRLIPNVNSINELGNCQKKQ